MAGRVGTPGGLRPEDAPVEETAEMGFWLLLDEELVGALDDNGCFHDPSAVNDMLTEYGITEEESRKVARRFLRTMGGGRAQALFDDDEDKEERRDGERRRDELRPEAGP